jgi:hypothetical protein
VGLCLPTIINIPIAVIRLYDCSVRPLYVVNASLVTTEQNTQLHSYCGGNSTCTFDVCPGARSMSLLRLLPSRKSYVHLSADGCTISDESKQSIQYNPKQKDMGCLRSRISRLLVFPCVAFLALLLGAQLLAARDTQPSPLYSCINEGLTQQLTTYKDFAYQRPARCVSSIAVYVLKGNQLPGDVCLHQSCVASKMMQPNMSAVL